MIIYPDVVNYVFFGGCQMFKQNLGICASTRLFHRSLRQVRNHPLRKGLHWKNHSCIHNIPQLHAKTWQPALSRYLYRLWPCYGWWWWWWWWWSDRDHRITIGWWLTERWLADLQMAGPCGPKLSTPLCCSHPNVPHDFAWEVHTLC